MSENEILIIDGVEYSLWSARKENELEESVKFHAKNIFGPDSIYFDVKKRITSSVGTITIPDAYLIDFINKSFYIIEIELAAHPEYDHINKQIGRFIAALENYKTRQKIAKILKEYIDEDIVKQKFVSDKIGNIELYQFFLEDILENVREQNYRIVVIIDEITKRISEACNILNPRPKLVEFKTYVRKNVGDMRVHCHLFTPLFTYPVTLESEKPSRKKPRGYTGKIPEKVEIFNETYEVKYWRDVLVKTAETLIKKSPELLNNLADSNAMTMEKHVWLSKKKNVMRAPYRLSNGLYISTGLSANSIFRLIKRLLKGCGYNESDIKIFLKD